MRPDNRLDSKCGEKFPSYHWPELKCPEQLRCLACLGWTHTGSGFRLLRMDTYWKRVSLDSTAWPDFINNINKLHRLFSQLKTPVNKIMISSTRVRHRTGKRDEMWWSPYIKGQWIARVPANQGCRTLTGADEMKWMRWVWRNGGLKFVAEEIPRKITQISFWPLRDVNSGA